MATEIIMVDADRPGHVKLGAWKTHDGMITVAYLGRFPSETTQLGGHESIPAALARLMLSEFK